MVDRNYGHNTLRRAWPESGRARGAASWPAFVSTSSPAPPPRARRQRASEAPTAVGREGDAAGLGLARGGRRVASRSPLAAAAAVPQLQQPPNSHSMAPAARLRVPALLVAAALCALLAPQGAALRCWLCSSSTDPRCRDPFNSTRLAQADCDRHRAFAAYSDRAYCQKTVTSINGGDKKVIRKCVFSREVLDGRCFDQPQSTDFLTVEHCSTCDADGCNGARPLAAPAAPAAAAASLVACWVAARLLR